MAALHAWKFYSLPVAVGVMVVIAGAALVYWTGAAVAFVGNCNDATPTTFDDTCDDVLDPRLPKYVYRAENPNAQVTDSRDAAPSGSVENELQYSWQIGNELKWYVDPPAGSFQNKVAVAITEWGSLINDGLPWKSTMESDSSTAHVIFYESAGPYCPGFGSYRPFNIWYDDWRRANYTVQSEICIDTSSGDPDLFKKFILHEIGHVYGLADRYRFTAAQPAVCNQREITVMNHPNCPAPYWSPPTLQKDAERIRHFYGKSANVNMWG
ncbi:MAG: hypothetical protein HY532_04980 [Chloroflexi bacterium]|nr:hypothetical protein [Chloroflexota bacterium]